MAVSSSTLSQASSTSAVSRPRAQRAWRSGSSPTRSMPSSRWGRGRGWPTACRRPGCEVVVGDHLVGRAQAVVGAEQDGRPPDGVEPDVVLADEVAVAGGRPATSDARRPGRPVARPIPPSRQVADDGVEPRTGGGRPSRAGAGTPQSRSRVIARGRRPAASQPRASAPTNGRQARLVAVEVAGHRLQQVEAGGTAGAGAAARPGRRSAGSGAPQLLRVEGAAAGVALVPAGVGAPHDSRSPPRSGRAGAALAPAEGGRLGRLGDQPALAQAANSSWVTAWCGGGGLGVVVEGDAGAGEAGRDALVLAVGQGGRRQPGPLGRDRDRGAVLVGPGDQQDQVAGQPVVAGGDVGGQ